MLVAMLDSKAHRAMPDLSFGPSGFESNGRALNHHSFFAEMPNVAAPACTASVLCPV